LAKPEPSFRGISIVEIVLTPVAGIPLPMGAIITAVVEPWAFTKIGKRWESIEKHLIQYNLFGEEETRDWLMSHGKTFYDWLKESLPTRE
jgi:hypothetical protein